MRYCFLLWVFLFGVLTAKGQDSVENILGSNISDAEIERSIRALLGDDFSLLINNPGVDIQAIILEQLERELIKSSAGASLTSLTAVAIMDAYEQLQKGKLASEISNVRDVLNQESEKILRLQQNLLKLKMQNKLSGSNLPSYQVMQSFSVKDLAHASSSDMRMNELISKSGIGANLSVYERLRLAEKINHSIKSKVSQDINKQLIRSSELQLKNKQHVRVNKSKLITTNN